MRITILSLVVLLLNVTMAVGEPEIWADDIFVAITSENVFQQTQIDSIVAEFSCTNYDIVGKRVVRFFLPAGSDEESIVNTISASLPAGISSVFLEELWIMPEDEGKSDSFIETPASIQPYSNTSYSTDPLYHKQWYLNEENTNIWPVWNEPGADYDDVVIFIVDSGLEHQHEEFTDAYELGQIEILKFTGSADPTWTEDNCDESGHGTAITGVVSAAHNGVGIMGVAPGVKVFVGDVFYPDPDHGSIASPGNFLTAFEAIEDSSNAHPEWRIVVLTCSDMEIELDNAILQEFIKVLNSLADNHNVLLVSASGNEAKCRISDEDILLHGTNPFGYSSFPAWFSTKHYDENIDDIVVAVGASCYSYISTRDSAGISLEGYYKQKAADYTSFQYLLPDTCALVVDVASPGGGATVKLNHCYFEDHLGVFTTFATVDCYDESNCYDYIMGTSFAAPQVAGIAALTWAHNPGLTAEEVKSLLRAHSRTHQVIKDNLVLIGGRWGNHRFRLFRQNYEDNCEGGVFLDDPPPVWPTGDQKDSYGNFSFDTFCSPVIGSGIVDGASTVLANASRNIYRVFGGTITEDITLDNADIVRVYGDLIIPDGVTFTVTPNVGNSGVVWSMMGADLQKSGNDTTAVEIIVEAGGSLVIDASRTTFYAYKYDESWSGIKVDAGGTFGNPGIDLDVTLYGTKNGIIINSDSFYVGTLEINSFGNGLVVEGSFTCETLNVQSDGTGVVLGFSGSLDVAGAVDIANYEESRGMAALEFHDNSALSCATLTINNYQKGIKVAPDCSALLLGDIFIGDVSAIGCLLDSASSLAITGVLVLSPPEDSQCSVGFLLGGGSQFHSPNPVEIYSCYYGMAAGPDGPVQFDGGIEGTNCEHGIMVSSTSLILQTSGAQFVGSGTGIGVFIIDGEIASANTIYCSGFDYGLKAIDCHESTLQGNFNILESSIHGVLFENCSDVSLLGPTSIESSAQNGIYLNQSTDILIQDIHLSGNLGAGLGVYNGSSGFIRDSILDGNQNELIVDNFSTFDAGNFQSSYDAGMNEFTGSLRSPVWYFVSNLNPDQTVSAEGNIWNGGTSTTCPPSSSHLWGSVETTCE